MSLRKQPRPRQLPLSDFKVLPPRRQASFKAGRTAVSSLGSLTDNKFVGIGIGRRNFMMAAATIDAPVGRHEMTTVCSSAAVRVETSAGQKVTGRGGTKAPLRYEAALS